MSCAHAVYVRASVFENWNHPVSVAAATKSARAIDSVSGQSAATNSSSTIRPVADAEESMISTVPRPSFVMWWSRIRMEASVLVRKSSKIGSWLLLFTSRRMTRSYFLSWRDSMSMSLSRMGGFLSKRKSYHSGISERKRGSAFLPRVVRASVIACIEPQASPSGRVWLEMRTFFELFISSIAF